MGVGGGVSTVGWSAEIGSYAEASAAPRGLPLAQRTGPDGVPGGTNGTVD